MKEDKSKKGTLVCDGWSGFLGVASDLPRASYRKGKEYYLICFLAWRGWIYWSLSWHGYNLQRRRWHQNFRLAPEGEVWWQWWWVVLPCDCRHSLVSPRWKFSLNHGVFLCVYHIWWLWEVRGSLEFFCSLHSAIPRLVDTLLLAVTSRSLLLLLHPGNCAQHL